MKFTSKSVIFEGGCRVHLDVYLPSFLMDYDIPDTVWKKAINDFNDKLDSRTSCTTMINEVKVDVLKLESIEVSKDLLELGAVVLLIVMRENDLPKIKDIHFCLTGYLTFEGNSGKVDGMVINNITYGGPDSKAFKILDEPVSKPTVPSRVSHSA